MAKSYQKPNLFVRWGLGLLSSGITLSLIAFLMLAISALINKDKGVAWINTASSWIYFIAAIANVAGLIFCLLSGEKRFAVSLLFYIIAFAFAIVIIATHKDPKPWVYMVNYSILALSYLSFILGIRDVGAKSKLCVLFNFACVVCYIAGIACFVFNNGAANLLVTIGNISFLVCVLLANKAIKRG